MSGNWKVNPVEISFYRTLVDVSPVGTALHKLIRNEYGKAVDYEFLYVNKAFEEQTGLKNQDISEKRVTEVLPDLEKGTFSWLRMYEDLFNHGETVSFEQYSHPLNRWYRVTAKAFDASCFVTYFVDITSEKQVISDRDTMLITLNHIVFEIDENFIHTNVLTENESHLFLPKEEIIGLSVRELLPLALAKPFEETMLKSKRTGQTEMLQYESPLPGDDRYFRAEIRYGQFVTGRKWVASIRDVSAEVKAEQERLDYQDRIYHQRRRMEYILEGTNAGTWEWDMISNRVTVNERWAEMKGYRFEDVDTFDMGWFLSLIHPEDHEALSRKLARVNEGSMPVYEIEMRIRHQKGHYIWIEARGKILERSENGEPILMSGTHLDITKRKVEEIEREMEREQFKTTLLSIGDGVITTDAAGRVTMMNRMAESTTGWQLHEAKNRKIEEVFKLVHADSGEEIASPVQMAIESQAKVELGEDIQLIKKSGEKCFVHDSVAPIYSGEGILTGTVIVFRDISEKYEQVKQIRYLSDHDQLTGMYNRHYYERIMMEIEKNPPANLSVIVADVNGLKLANDGFGHQFGDRLLEETGRILENEIRSGEIVARIGGDEFVILLPGVNEKEAKKRMETLHEKLNKGKVDDIYLSVSLGFSSLDPSDSHIEEVFKRAEDRMYRKKIDESRAMRESTIEILLKKLKLSEGYHSDHAERVVTFSVEIGKGLDMSAEELEDLRLASIMHDIGLVSVDPALLIKPVSSLTEEEKVKLQKHPETGYQLLRTSTEFSRIADIVLCHQEQMDGSGYPRGITAGQIPLESRIINTARFMDRALSYRNESKEKVVEDLKRAAGTTMDQDVVRQAISILS
ncbi:PAS domain S-box protein [Salisediminibacterium selenitireducens]|uniref:Diguanylate cyclase and metal dependent phosphohydrolase n=1 Tax=Bacillus selenitireducens (strain ATCC 700615 / DSM 15326 / MLS10) TaxID=439292 RepID=D6XWT5_BACIE|nr:PAS domain S-box protein [Salisediminibacterium selenitireducens]ADH99911.1 diguanylate cyclase and metal dependent phosphohydrolase [[Bacillus] selenitireducens MLS10]